MPGRERPVFMIPTKSPQPARTPADENAVLSPSHRGRPVLAARPEGVSAPGPGGRSSGAPAAGGREIFATAEGIIVYPPRAEGERWRAVWHEPDGRRGRCQAVTEGRLTAKLEPVAERRATSPPRARRSVPRRGAVRR